MAETYAFSGTIDVDNGTFEGTITGQEAPPVEPPPIEPPPVEPPPVEPPPVEPPAGPPGPVTDLAAAASGTSSIVLSWTAVAGATDYNIQGSPDNRIWSDIGGTHRTNYRVSGLAAGTSYWARIFSENIDGEWGEVSNVATATTEAAPVPEPGEPGDAVFYDDFNGYPVGKVLSGVTPPVSKIGGKWAYVTGDRGNIKIGSGGRNGGNCLHVNYGAGSDYSYIEQHVQLCGDKSRALQECWVEFYMMTDNTRAHHADNEKFMAFHNDFFATGGRAAYGRQSTVLNCQGMDLYSHFGSFSASHYTQSGEKVRSSSHTEETGGVPPFGYGYSGNSSDWTSNWRKSCRVNPSGSVQRAVTKDQAGQWIRYRIYIKQNDIGRTNGEFKWWREDRLIQHTNNIARQWDDGYNKNDGLYLGGWRNGGFVSNATWKYDEFAVYNTDPGWTF